LKCYSNKLTSLDVSANTALTSLNCGSNQLTSLDVSTNTALTDLDCWINPLTSLDVSANTALTSLNCGSNQLTSLDVSVNIALSYLVCSSNQLSSLDISVNIALFFLVCSSNQLTSLDVSANTALITLKCYDNELISLDVRNGNNSIIEIFDATSNPNLTCIYVDDKSAAYLSNWTKDASTSFVNSEAECTASSVNELKENTDFAVYPNPVKEEFSIQTNKKIETISVYNVEGKLVKTYNKQNTYSVSGLQSGVYFINIRCTTKCFTQKLIIE
jgi:hypothetical protein